MLATFKKENLLFVVLGGFFIANAILAELIGVKLFSLEETLGISPFHFDFFGQTNMSFNMTAGVLLWPVVFVMTDIINEYYGKKGVKILSYLAVVLISYVFLMAFMAIKTTPAGFWVESNKDIQPDINYAYGKIFGQGLWIIVGSIFAFLVSQLVDVTVFQYLRKYTGEKSIWVRATGSTLVSQLIDSFVVLFIAFYIGQGWTLSLVLAVCTVNYIYKFLMAILLTPIIYLVHEGIERYLGVELAEKLKLEAHQNE